MDPTDLALSLILLNNSRTPLRDLGEKLGLSVASVHKRLQALRDEGIIKAFTARIGLPKLGATIALAWGVSKATSSDHVQERLHKDDHVYWVTFAGAGTLYVGAYLRSLTELDAYMAYLVKEAEIENPVVGLFPQGTGLPDEPVLDRLDCRILRALHKDARKSIADVAEEIGLSPKTVGRRLGKMEADGSAELSIEWSPDASNDIITMWHLDLAPSADRDQAIALLMNRYRDNFLFHMAFSNLPRFLLFATWTGSTKDLRLLRDRISAEAPFARVLPNMLYTGHLFDTWRDDLLMKWAGPKDAAR